MKLRELLATHRGLAEKLAALERKLARHDAEIRSLFDAIKHIDRASRPEAPAAVTQLPAAAPQAGAASPGGKP